MRFAREGADANLSGFIVGDFKPSADLFVISCGSAAGVVFALNACFR